MPREQVSDGELLAFMMISQQMHLMFYAIPVITQGMHRFSAFHID